MHLLKASGCLTEAVVSSDTFVVLGASYKVTHLLTYYIHFNIRQHWERLKQLGKCTDLGVLRVMHHIGVITSDGRLSLLQSPGILLQVLVARPYHTDEVQLSHTSMQCSSIQILISASPTMSHAGCAPGQYHAMMCPGTIPCNDNTDQCQSYNEPGWLCPGTIPCNDNTDQCQSYNEPGWLCLAAIPCNDKFYCCSNSLPISRHCCWQSIF